MNSFNFYSIGASAQAEYKVLGSKFLSYAYPVSSLAEIKEKLEQGKKKHFDATHICYAYRLGVKGETWRAHDAGEPAHSAGDPILGQLRSKNVTNSLVIVVRYFGGTKLGVGGLVSAYKTAAELVLTHCKIVQHELTFEVELFFEYPQMAAVMRLQHEVGAKVVNQVFESSCFARWSIGLGKLPLFEEKIKSIPIKIEIKN